MKQEKLVEENLLVMLKLFAGKKQMSRKRREDKDGQEYSNFRPPPPTQPKQYSGNDRDDDFLKRCLNLV